MIVGVHEFRLWATGFRLPTRDHQIPFVGTFEEVWAEMKRYYGEAGSPPYSHVIANYWGGCQMRYPGP